MSMDWLREEESVKEKESVVEINTLFLWCSKLIHLTVIELSEENSIF